MASRLGPAKPRGSTWNGAGAWLIVSQSRQVNFSRTCCTTFHCRGTTSSVSVTSSPSLASLVEPQQAQAVGPGTTIRSRGRCAGNGPACRLPAREGAHLGGVAGRGGGLLGSKLVLGGRRFELLELELHLVDQTCLALVARPKNLALELLDRQPQMAISASALAASARTWASSASLANSSRCNVSTSSGGESCVLIAHDGITPHGAGKRAIAR